MKKRKLNWVAVGNMMGLIISIIVMFEYFYILCIKPFIDSNLAGLTPFGMITFIFAFIMFASNIIYFKDRLQD